jgi:hypothetical protein
MSFNSQGREGAVGPLRQELFDKFIDRYFPGPWPGGTVPQDVASAHAQMMAGYYDDSRRPDRSCMSLLEILSPSRVAVAQDGTLTMSLMKGPNGELVHYREIAPFVWRATTTGRRLAAEAVDGRVVRLSMDELSPFMVFDPTPAWKSPSWLLPALGAALTACLLTGLLWPLAAISRRRHGVQLPVVGLGRRAHGVSRVAALALAAVTVGWLALLLGGTKDLANLSPSLDPVLILMYALSVIVYIGGTAALFWSAWVAWTTARPLGARIWTLILAISSLILLYTAVIYHLLSFVT